MKTLEYYWSDGTHTVFDNYTIDEEGAAKNITLGSFATRHQNVNGYNMINVRHEGKQRQIRLARALASTFLGPPPTLQHTADHEDKNRSNDTLKNISWKDKSEQVKNRTMPSDFKSSFIIEKDGVERTAKEWTEVFMKPNGEKYTTRAIKLCAQEQRLGFRYKAYPNLPREVWKTVKGSQNKKGEWLISSKSRVKYRTPFAEHVLTSAELCKNHGYPVIRINDKQWKCHELSFMTFRPNEYASKKDEDIILHKNDDRFDFGPFRLRFGSRSENGTDAHDNGKFDNTKSARKPVMSFINGIFEKEHESIHAAARYMRENDYPRAVATCVSRALRESIVYYGRTWKQ